MRGRTPLVAALLVALTSGVAAAAAPTAHGLLSSRQAAVTSAPSDAHVARAPLSAKVAAALGPGGEMRGMALNDFNLLHSLDTSIADFPRMKADGITSVTAYIYLYVQGDSGSVVSTGPGTPSDTELSLVTTAAKALGLGVHYMPVLVDPQQTPRGHYVPSDMSAFFASYTTMINHYADLAQSNGVTLFYVGSENDWIANQTAKWLTLIASVRTRYAGALSYMPTGYSALLVHFWNALDLVSVSPYYSLGDEKTVTYGRLLSAWMKDHLPYLAKVAKVLKKPIVLGEIGYHSETGGYTAPAFDTHGLPAPQAQADAYRALLDAMETTPYVYGLSWWRWSEGASLDTGYSPAGKPAECAIIAHWSTNAVARQLATLPLCNLAAIDSLTNATGVGQH